VGERQILAKLIAMAYQMQIDKSSSSSSSSSSSLSSSWGTSSSSDSSSFDSSSSDSSMDTVDDFVIPTIIEYANYIYAPMEDTSIVFNAWTKIIDDYNHYQCLTYFRYRKEDLQLLADEMWLGMQHFLEGTRDKIVVMNGYIIPYETGLCILLFRFMNPMRFRGDMESFFTIRQSKLHSVVTTFTDAVFRYATPFFVGPQIYVHCFPYYAQLINNTSNGAATNIWGFIDGTLRRSC
jgi:hypothetical protein